MERYLRQEEREESKQAYLNAMTTFVGRCNNYPAVHFDPRGSNRFMGRDRQPPGRFRPFARDDRRGRREELHAIEEKIAVNSTKKRYCEYHQSRTHDTINCAVLKKEIEEKHIKWNVIKIA